MADAQEFLSVLGDFKGFYVMFGYIVMVSLIKCKNNDQTCLFQCINISRLSRKQFAASCSNNFLEPRQMLMHEKNMYDPYILIYLLFKE